MGVRGGSRHTGLNGPRAPRSAWYASSVATVRLGDFEWDEAKARTNLRKHGVSFTDAVTVFLDPRAIDAPDLQDPGRFVVIGRATNARVLFVVHVERGSRVRLISARKASPSQRRIYEEG
jgi:uncharacterized protein